MRHLSHQLRLNLRHKRVILSLSSLMSTFVNGADQFVIARDSRQFIADFNGLSEFGKNSVQCLQRPLDGTGGKKAGSHIFLEGEF